MENTRTVRRVLPSVETLEGAGFLVHRPFPTSALDHFDPFLLLDEMGPMDLGPGRGQGRARPSRIAASRPSRTCSSGSMEHGDSRGNRGKLGPGRRPVDDGGLGRRALRDARPRTSRRSGGRMHGFQLWVNLPRRDKMMTPRYQEVPAGRDPRRPLGGRVASPRA